MVGGRVDGQNYSPADGMRGCGVWQPILMGKSP